MPISGAVGTRIRVISPTTGLVGYPDVADQGRVIATTLLDPSMLPGDRYRVEGELLAGDYVAETVEHHGDLYGVPWYTVLTGRPA